MQPSRRGSYRVAALALAAVVSVLAGCAASSSSASPGPSTFPGPSLPPGTTLDAGDLRLLLVDRLGPRWYCDRDEFPIAHGDEQSNALEALPQMQAEGVVFQAVIRRLGLDGVADLSATQTVEVYRLWKVAVSIPLDPIGSGRYRFDYTAQPVGGVSEGLRSTGTISGTGDIVVESQAPAGGPNCPICLARGTPIETPHGPVAVERLALGDAIWTLDASGRRVAGVVIALGSTVAPADHRVIRLALADGRTVTASPGHPLADGRRLAGLQLGDIVDGSVVVALDSLPYAGARTFDLVASGPTGTYLSGGIALGSTLR